MLPFLAKHTHTRIHIRAIHIGDVRMVGCVGGMTTKTRWVPDYWAASLSHILFELASVTYVLCDDTATHSSTTTFCECLNEPWRVRGKCLCSPHSNRCSISYWGHVLILFSMLISCTMCANAGALAHRHWTTPLPFDYILIDFFFAAVAFGVHNCAVARIGGWMRFQFIHTSSSHDSRIYFDEGWGQAEVRDKLGIFRFSRVTRNVVMELKTVIWLGCSQSLKCSTFTLDRSPSDSHTHTRTQTNSGGPTSCAPEYKSFNSGATHQQHINTLTPRE